MQGIFHGYAAANISSRFVNLFGRKWPVTRGETIYSGRCAKGSALSPLPTLELVLGLGVSPEVHDSVELLGLPKCPLQEQVLLYDCRTQWRVCWYFTSRTPAAKGINQWRTVLKNKLLFNYSPMYTHTRDPFSFHPAGSSNSFEGPWGVVNPNGGTLIYIFDSFKLCFK